MLYDELLKGSMEKVKPIISSLFETAFKKQSHNGDILLVINHAFLNTLNYQGSSKYKMGLGDEGIAWTSFTEYFQWYLTNHTLPGDPTELKKTFKENKDWRRGESIITQFELMLFLKLWECDYFLKILFNLCRLANGHSYCWDKNMKHKKAAKLIENEIIQKTSKVCPPFSKILYESYNRQIRNAIAHSQFKVNQGNLNLLNIDKVEENSLRNITLEKWETMFHNSIAIYLSVLRHLKEYHLVYKNQLSSKNDIIQVRFDGEEPQNLNVKLHNYGSRFERWTWA